MKRILKTLAMGMGASVFAWAGLSMAAEAEGNQGRDLQLKLRVRAEYDDNIYERSSGKQDSFKFEVEPELIYNMDFERTYIGLRYRPTFVWWSDREPDDTDLHHDFDIDIAQKLSPKLSLSLKESFLYAQQPELIDRGTVISEKDDYIYNRVNGDLAYALRTQTKLNIGARHTLLQYTEDEVSNLEDYDIYAAGATLRQQLSAQATVLGELRGESISYSGPDRDADSIYVGAGFEQTFSPGLLGNIRAGLQHKTFSADTIDDSDSPYFDGSVTFLPSPRTRLTAGAGFSMFESDVYPFANQDRTLVYLSAAHDLTARISLFLTGSFQNSDYNADQSIDESLGVEDGSEQVAQISARGSYKVNRNNWLEAGYQYLDLSSDVRPEFDRNRFSVGWRTAL